MGIFKLTYVILLIFELIWVTAAGSYSHQHLHSHLKARAVETRAVIVPVRLFEYQGHVITEAEACQGIVNGTFHWAPGSKDTPSCGGHVFSSAASSSRFSTSFVRPSNTMRSSSTLNNSIQKSAATVIASTPAISSMSSAIAVSSSVTGSMPLPSVTTTNSPSSGFDQDNSNVTITFPDGELDCTEFPSAYGAVHIPWMELGGWTGIQYAEVSNGFVTGLSTGVKGNECATSQDGSMTFCSYACPPGYQKSQWPAAQGGANMAVSVGGLKCVNGKLHLTNSNLSNMLCIPGTGKSVVVNKLDGSASICRTDYPGTEDETIPLQTFSGNTYPLTCPDSSTYYQHLGAQTSAEYYVNNKDVSVEAACQWGQDGTDEGNWAPVVIGAETDSSGATWLSIMTSRQNNPTNYQELDYSIEIVGDFGGAACYYTQHKGVGYYCSSGALAEFDPNQPSCKYFDPSAGVTVPGCTVQLFSGIAEFHLVETT